MLGDFFMTETKRKQDDAQGPTNHLVPLVWRKNCLNVEEACDLLTVADDSANQNLSLPAPIFKKALKLSKYHWKW